jgi:hypothetical protein
MNQNCLDQFRFFFVNATIRKNRQDNINRVRLVEAIDSLNDKLLLLFSLLLYIMVG